MNCFACPTVGRAEQLLHHIYAAPVAESFPVATLAHLLWDEVDNSINTGALTAPGLTRR